MGCLQGRGCETQRPTSTSLYNRRRTQAQSAYTQRTVQITLPAFQDKTWGRSLRKGNKSENQGSRIGTLRALLSRKSNENSNNFYSTIILNSVIENRRLKHVQVIERPCQIQIGNGHWATAGTRAKFMRKSIGYLARERSSRSQSFFP